MIQDILWNIFRIEKMTPRITQLAIYRKIAYILFYFIHIYSILNYILYTIQNL